MRISGYLAIKALVERGIITLESALKWIQDLTKQNGNDPHVWVAHAEALAACGPQALDDLQQMSVSQDQPPQVRRSMLHYIALVKDERSLSILADIVDPDNQQDQNLVEGALICLSRIHEQYRWTENGKKKVVAAIEKLWNKLGRPQIEQNKDIQNIQRLILQIFQLAQSDISQDILDGALGSKNPLIQLNALRLQVESFAREDSINGFSTETELRLELYREIILQTGGCAGNHIDLLSSLLARLATLPEIAKTFFNDVYLRNLLISVVYSLHPAVLKLIRTTNTDLMSFFKREQNETSNNSLSSLLQEGQEVGVRLGAMTILSNWPELWELDSVSQSILNQADPNHNQEPATSSKALELLVKHRLHDEDTQEVLIKWCLALGNDPSRTAIKLIGENIFSFKLPENLSDQFIESIKACYENTTNSISHINDFSIFSLCQFYSLLLRISAVQALWPAFNTIFPKTIDRLMIASLQGKSYLIRTGGQAMRGMFSAYRMALGTDYNNISGGTDNFTGPLRAISQLCEKQSTNSMELRTKLMVSYFGLNLYREPPLSLHEAFKKLNCNLKTLFNNHDIQNNSLSLHKMIEDARKEVKEIAAELDSKAPKNQNSHLEITTFCHQNTSLGIALQKYLDNPGRDVFHEVKRNIEDLFPAGTEDDWLKSFWDYSAAYLTKRDCSQETWWLNTTRFLLHNLNRQAKNLPDNSVEATTALARRFLSLPSLINSLMLNVPENIPLAEFIKQSKKKLEKDFHCPNSFFLGQIDQSLNVYFDKRRLFSVLENCYTNALHSVEEYNQDAAMAEHVIEVREPSVQISAKNTEYGIEIIIEDNGNGLPDDFMITPEKQWGLGTFIIQGYIESADGKVSWEDNNHRSKFEGARVRIQLPKMEISSDA